MRFIVFCFIRKEYDKFRFEDRKVEAGESSRQGRSIYICCGIVVPIKRKWLSLFLIWLPIVTSIALFIQLVK